MWQFLCIFAIELRYGVKYPLHRYNIFSVDNMARPIRETPVLKGEDAFNFEMRRLEVENMSKEQRAENLRKVEEGYARAKSYINFHW